MRRPDIDADSFREQAVHCRRLGSPFTATLCMVLPDALPLSTRTARRVAEWPGDPRADALALRLAGALHHLKRSGLAPGLEAVYPPHDAPEAELRAAVSRAVEEHDERIAAALDRPPQTNEVARSAILLGGLMLLSRQGMPLELLEIGASGGLNLLPDHWRYELGEGRHWGAANAPLAITCDWRGPAPALRRLCISDRAGADLAPIDPRNRGERERLLSYIWADQSGRLARTEAALAHAARRGVAIERADAAEWLEERLARPQEEGTVRVLMHSIMWQYLGASAQHRLTRAMVAYGVETDQRHPLAWLRVETDGAAETAAVILTTWPGGRTRELGRADFHGRYVIWSGER